MNFAATGWQQQKQSSAGVAGVLLPAPEPQDSPTLSSSAHAATSGSAGTLAAITSKPGFASAQHARQGGRNYFELCFPASSGLLCYIDLARFLRRATRKNPHPCCCFCLGYHFKTHGPFDQHSFCICRLDTAPSGSALLLQL